MSTLQDLPNEILSRIIEEVSDGGYGQSNPVHSLILTSRRFCALALPYLYRSITISSFDQLALLVDRNASGAWNLPSHITFKHIHISIASHSECSNQTDQWEAETGLCSELGELVHSSLPGYLEDLSIKLISVEDAASYSDPNPCDYFEDVLSIQANRVECTIADDTPIHIDHFEYLDPYQYGRTAAVLRNNAHLKYLRLPFLWFAGDNEKLINTLTNKRQIKRLHLEWPIELDNKAAAELLCGLQATLLDKGLVLDAPASQISSCDESLQYISDTFQEVNPDLSLAGIRDELVRRHRDVEALMDKLDWRVPDFQPPSDEQDLDDA